MLLIPGCFDRRWLEVRSWFWLFCTSGNFLLKLCEVYRTRHYRFLHMQFGCSKGFHVYQFDPGVRRQKASSSSPVLKINDHATGGRRTKDILGGPKGWGPKKKVANVEIYVIFEVFAFCGGRTKTDFKDRGYKSAFVKTAWAPGEAMLARSWHFVAQMRLIHDPSWNDLRRWVSAIIHREFKVCCVWDLSIGPVVELSNSPWERMIMKISE